MFDNLKRLIMNRKIADIGPPIPPRPDIPKTLPLSPVREFKGIFSNGRGSNHEGFNTNTNRRNSLSWIEDVERISCYWDRVDNERLVKIMNKYLHKTGAYIIRRSNTNPNALTISVVHTQSHIYHFKVLPQNNMYEVTKNLKFNTIDEVIEYFKEHDIPGTEIQDLKLTIPIENEQRLKNCHRSKSLEHTPINRPPPQLPRRVSEPDPIRDRDRQPTPPPTDAEEHKYTEVTEVDRLPMIREQCLKLDQRPPQRQKCECGLYYEESILIHDWMMHRSMERRTLGRIFFTNQKTKETTFTLPPKVVLDLKLMFPERFSVYLRHKQEIQ